MRLIDLGTSPAVVCDPHATMRQVARKLAENDVGSVVVVDERDRLVGMVTDRDLVVRGLATGALPDTPIATVMSHDVVSVSDTASPVDAARQMAVRRCRRLPVVDVAGHVVGVVSADDLVRYDAATLEHLDRVLAHERRTLAEPWGGARSFNHVQLGLPV
jgi:signal-transduction protein with cAMP-binding, CBS, and nucleotidyltransferase domain